jgi:hypothetical protein
VVAIWLPSLGNQPSADYLLIDIMERAKGFEPSTPTLARLCSTPELRPRSGRGHRRALSGMIPGVRGFARPPIARTCAAADAAASCGDHDGPARSRRSVPAFKVLGIAYCTHHHLPVVTVVEAVLLRGSPPRRSLQEPLSGGQKRTGTGSW